MKRDIILTSVLIAASTLIIGCSNNGSDDIYSHKYRAVQIDKGDSWSIIDGEGNIIVKGEYSADDQVSNIYGETYWVKSGDKFQLFSISSPKKPLTADEWDFATEMFDDRALVGKVGEPISIINGSGKIISTLGKDIAKASRDIGDGGNILIKKSDGTSGWADENGKIIKDNLYDVTLGKGDIAAIAHKKKDSDKYTIFDSKGNETGEFTADYIVALRDGYIGIHKSEKGKLINKNGEMVLESKKYIAITPPYFGNCIVVNEDSKFGIMNLEGEELIRAKYKLILPSREDLFIAVKEEGKTGVINFEDETVIDFEYGDALNVGGNFLMQDGSTYILLGRDGKRIGKQEFYSYSKSPCVKEISYVNVEELETSILSMVAKFDPNKTIANVATELGKKPSGDFAYTDHFSDAKTMAGQVATIYYTFWTTSLAREKFHEKTTNDGWFDHTEQVSDGWVWMESNMSGITIIFPTIDNDINQTIELIASRLKQKGYDNEGYENHPNMIKDNHHIEITQYGNGIQAVIGIWEPDPGC